MRTPASQTGDTLRLEMEDPAQTPAPAGPNGSKTGKNRPAAPARCVLLCASSPPPDLTRALEHKGVSTLRAPNPEVALAMLVRAHREARAAGAHGPILLVAVDPGALGPASEHLLRCVQIYAPHAVCWRFDQRRSPQLAAWRLAPPKPVVVSPPPATTVSGPGTPRPTAEPRLRLVGEQSFRAPSPPSTQPLFAGPGIPLATGKRRMPESKDMPAPAEESDQDAAPPPVSDAELKMLLSGDPKNDPRPPRRT